MQINIKNERDDLSIGCTSTERIIKEYYGQVYANNHNLHEINKSLESCQLPKLMQEKVNNMGISVYIQEIYIEKSLPTKKMQAYIASLVNSTTHVKKRLYQFYMNSSRKLKRRYFPIHSLRPVLCYYKTKQRLYLDIPHEDQCGNSTKF